MWWCHLRETQCKVNLRSARRAACPGAWDCCHVSHFGTHFCPSCPCQPCYCTLTTPLHRPVPRSRRSLAAFGPPVAHAHSCFVCACRRFASRREAQEPYGAVPPALSGTRAPGQWEDGDGEASEDKAGPLIGRRLCGGRHAGGAPLLPRWLCSRACLLPKLPLVFSWLGSGSCKILGTALQSPSQWSGGQLAVYLFLLP